jgi:HAD superfamily hydrolase (TIGR01509 family)
MVSPRRLREAHPSWHNPLVPITQYDALIFDMDGLMVDSEPVWWRVEQSFAHAHGIEWSEDRARSCVGKGLEHVISTMREQLGLTISVEEGVRLLQRDFVARQAEIHLKPGCEELVGAARARGMSLAVASSSPTHLIHAVLDQVAMRHSFDILMSGVDVPEPKPAPDIFLRTAERLGAPPRQCVVLEDSIAGVRAGVAAQMRVIAVPEDEPQRFARLTPHVVDNLHEASSLLGLTDQSQ